MDSATRPKSSVALASLYFCEPTPMSRKRTSRLLASDAAAFVTGTVLSVDGGRLAGA
jgi:NAD(P)-dependent dehydrogenase (short-subunit alcohol dehydrogenase family)